MQDDTSASGPIIILDESHKAKNLLQADKKGQITLTGFAVRLLQEHVPNAGVVYSSATGVSEPSNMAYMTRLGSFGFDGMTHLIKEMLGAGLGACELFSCGLKASGIYMSRCDSLAPADPSSFRSQSIHLRI